MDNLTFVVGVSALFLAIALIAWALQAMLRIEKGGKKLSPIWAIMLSYLALSFTFSCWFYLIRNGFKKMNVGETSLVAYRRVEEAINNELAKEGRFVIQFDQTTHLADISTSDKFIFRAHKVKVLWLLIPFDTNSEVEAAEAYYATDSIVSRLENLYFGTLTVVSKRESPSDARIIIEFDPSTLEVFESYSGWFPWVENINQEDRTLEIPFNYNLKEFSGNLFVDSVELTFWDCLYFGFLNSLAASYGDIIPINPVARISATMEIIGGILLISIVASRLLDRSRNIPLGQLFAINAPNEEEKKI